MRAEREVPPGAWNWMALEFILDSGSWLWASGVQHTAIREGSALLGPVRFIGFLNFVEFALRLT